MLFLSWPLFLYCCYLGLNFPTHVIKSVGLVCMHQNYLVDLVTHRLLSPTPKLSDSKGLGGA